MNNRNYVYFPITVLLAFLIFTEVLFWIGPIDYDIRNDVVLASYLLLVNIALFWGYRSGVKRFRSSSFKLGTPMVKFVLVVGLFSSVSSLFYMWGQRGIALNLTNLFDSVLNPGEVYHSENVNDANSTTFLTFTAPFLWASIPLGILYWRKVGKLFRFMLISIILIRMFSWLGIGTRKGLMDIFIFIISVFLACKKTFVLVPQNRKKIIRYVFSFSVLFLFYFVYSNLSRSGLGLDELQDDLLLARTEIREGYEKMPLWLVFSLISISSYLCQGYYALALGLDLGILPAAFGGSSWFTIMLATRLGMDPTKDTYMYILQQYGIDMSVNWHTAYVWLANDFTFIGVPIVVFWVGYFLAKTWLDCLCNKNDLAYVVMPFFVLMVFYFFANNQVMSFSFIPFFVSLVTYIIPKRYV